MYIKLEPNAFKTIDNSCEKESLKIDENVESESKIILFSKNTEFDTFVYGYYTNNARFDVYYSWSNCAEIDYNDYNFWEPYLQHVFENDDYIYVRDATENIKKALYTYDKSIYVTNNSLYKIYNKNGYYQLEKIY